MFIPRNALQVIKEQGIAEYKELSHFSQNKTYICTNLCNFTINKMLIDMWHDTWKWEKRNKVDQKALLTDQNKKNKVTFNKTSEDPTPAPARSND